MLHAREDYKRFQDPENKIPEDEPVMLFRAQDKYAAGAVEFYANLIASDPDATDEALNVSAVCFKWSEKMKAWPKQKSPDL